MAHPHSPYPPPPPPPPTGRRSGGGGKALPIACGAGLAVGVFVGLLVIRGTGDAEAEAAEDEVTPDAAVVATDTAPDAAPPPVIDAGPTIDAAAEIKKAKLTFEGIDGIDGLELEVDGKKVEGKTHEIVLGDASEVKVKITASARGYRTFRDRVVVSTDQIVEINMRKRRGGGGTTTSSGTGKGSGTGKKPPGGLIDL